MRITKLTQTLTVIIAAATQLSTGESRDARACRTLARRKGRAIFKLSLGHWRFSVNGPYLSSSEMRTGESCLLGSRFNFGLLKIGASRHKSKLRGAGAIVSGDGKRPEQYFGNMCMAVVETAAMNRGAL
jgi:hypothetical protein